MKTRRIASTLLILFIVLLTTVLIVSASAEDLPCYYVDQTNGDDSNPGTEDAPFQSLNAAGNKMTETGGIIRIMGTYTGSGTMPKGKNRLIIEGYDANSEISVQDVVGLFIGCETEFRNIRFAAGKNAYYETNGNTVILGTGVQTSAMMHIGSQNGKFTESEHIIIDGGAEYTGSMTIGAYHQNGDGGINGDVFFDVLNGRLGKLNLAQDGWLNSHNAVTIGGDVKIKVGSDGAIDAMSNTGRYAVVKGYLHVIVENGGKMCSYAQDHFEHKEVYRVNVDPTHGTVHNVNGTGLFEFAPDDGYLAKAEMPDGSVRYAGKTTLLLPVGTTDVSFVRAPMTWALSDAAAEPGQKNVAVTLSVSNNPGIISARLALEYDTSVLTLTDVQDAGILGSAVHSPTYSSPYTVYWMNGTAKENFTTNGTVVTFLFTVAQDAPNGKYPITLTCREDDFLNVELENVDASVQSGSVSVASSGYIVIAERKDTTISVGMQFDSEFEQQTAVAVFALYDENNRFSGVRFAEIETADIQGVRLTVQDEKYNGCMLYLLKDLFSLQPLAAPKYIDFS